LIAAGGPNTTMCSHRGGAYRGLCTDVGRGTRTIVDDEWLSQSLGQPLPYQTGQNVEHVPWGSRNDNPHWFRRIVGRHGHARKGLEGGGARC
jgi:hypothetical protein